MPSENVTVTEGLAVDQTPAAEVATEAVVPEPQAAPLGTEEPVNVITDGVVAPYVPPRVVTPEEAREKMLQGIGDTQPTSGSGQ